MTLREFLVRFVSLSFWCYGVWLLLTWTATAEQLLFGAGLSLVVALAMAPLGAVFAPWHVFAPRTGIRLIALLLTSAVRIVRANASLTRRIWLPSRPVPSGMIIVATGARTDGELAAVGLVTSLIVDNQIVDLDRSRNELQYHAVAVPSGTADERAEHVNAPTERQVLPIARRQ